MRVLVEGFEAVIEGEVIDGEPLDESTGEFDLGCEYTVRCDDGVCFKIHGWMVETIIVGGDGIPLERLPHYD